MVPWMGEFTDRVHWPFQLLSAHMGVTFLQTLDALVRGQNNGAVILLAAPVGETGEEESVPPDLREFARGVVPTLREFLP